MDSVKEESRWELFKQGTTKPITLSMASLQFQVWVGFGASVAAYTFFSNGSWGLGIMFLGVAGLQIVGTIRGWKEFKFLKSQEKSMDENQKMFAKRFANKLKELEKVK